MIEKIKIEDLQCTCVRNDASSRIAYMIYPLVNGFADKWITEQAKKNNCNIVVVYVPLDKWNDYLTPWPEPGETPKAEPFAGEASSFLKTLQEIIIPKAEKTLDIYEVAERDLIGVSLAGLFTLWQWMQCDIFRSIACLSGSFWYMGFLEWFDRQPIAQKEGKAFFLLGTEEPKSNIKAYRPVGINTVTVVASLKKAGIDAIFEWVSGDHFANPTERAEKALETISSHT